MSAMPLYRCTGTMTLVRGVTSSVDSQFTIATASCVAETISGSRSSQSDHVGAPSDRAAIQTLMQIAAVILEPINYNSGGVLPTPEFLQTLRTLTRELGIVLIFDEILSGFRTGPDCAQGYLGVTPDLCTLGKAIGGGLALSAFAGSREVMGAVSPLGGAVCEPCPSQKRERVL